MRQVPIQYLMIGSGRAARHLTHYFQQLHLPLFSWSRANGLEALLPHLTTSKIIICAITDDALPSFITSHLDPHHHKIVHLSGCLSIPNTIGAHPLTTFGDALMTKESYQRIPFVVDAPGFSELFPVLPNPYYFITPEKKALYHSACVLSGNFSHLLWEKFFTTLESLGIHRSVGYEYLDQVTQQLKVQSRLTGPLARGDQKTLDKHKEALEHDPYHRVYQAFIDTYREMHL